MNPSGFRATFPASFPNSPSVPQITKERGSRLAPDSTHGLAGASLRSAAALHLHLELRNLERLRACLGPASCSIRCSAAAEAERLPLLRHSSTETASGLCSRGMRRRSIPRLDMLFEPFQPALCEREARHLHEIGACLITDCRPRMWQLNLTNKHDLFGPGSRARRVHFGCACQPGDRAVSYTHMTLPTKRIV